MLSSQTMKVFLIFISMSFIFAKEEKSESGSVLRGTGRLLYDNGMMDSNGDAGDHHNGWMNSDETNSTYGDHNSQHNNGMMYWDESNSTDGDNKTYWHDNSESMHHGGNNNHHSGGFVAPNSRHCNTQQSDGQIQCSCRANMTDSMSDFEDDLEFKIQATKGDYLTIVVEYELDGESTQSDGNETEIRFSLVFDRLLEYRKVGKAVDNHYEWGIDEVVAETALNDWDELFAVPSTDNLIIYSAKSSMVTFTFTIAQTDSNDLTTNKMKIDFSLENYPWNASGDTFVALVNRIETHHKIEVNMEQGTDEVSDVLIHFKDAVQTIGFLPFGEYTWAKTAEATTGNVMDGLNGTDIMIERGASTGENKTTTIPVIASMSSATAGTISDANTTSEEIAFSFVGAGQGANHIFWDPEAGIGYSSTTQALSSSSTSRLAVSLLASVVSFGVMWWM